MGQRMVELASSYTVAKDGSVTMHVSQLPPNANIITPGPAWFFVLCNGVPSIGVEVMLGSGTIEDQPILAVQELPTSTVETTTGSHSAGGGSTNNNAKNAGSRLGASVELALGTALFGLLFW